MDLATPEGQRRFSKQNACLIAKRGNRIVTFMHGDNPHVGEVVQVAAEQFTFTDCIAGDEITLLFDDVENVRFERLLLVHEIADFMAAREALS